VREGASDIHISPEKDHVQIRFRVDGKLHEVPAPPRSMFLPIISRLKILANMDIALSRVPQDGRFTVKMKNKDINIRASTIPSIHGENLVLRLLDTSTSIYSLELLGMNEGDRQKVEAIITKPYGMILSTGPTAAARARAVLDPERINQPDINIITGRSVEYRIDKIRQVQLNRKAGMTFASGLRSILRQDPDVIMVGEIRDSETAGIAVQAALTGHRVLSTLHTNDAAGAMTRMMDMGIEPFLVSSVMLVSFAQRLVRRICPHCRQPYTPSPEAAKYWNLKDVDVSGMVLGQGCFNCMHTGFKGRTGVYEVLVIDDLVRDTIIRHCSSHEINRAAIQPATFHPADNALESVQGSPAWRGGIRRPHVTRRIMPHSATRPSATGAASKADRGRIREPLAALARGYIPCRSASPRTFAGPQPPAFQFLSPSKRRN
jgi:type IV pilus assembly protein PilB